ncbi:MAG TPA: thymidine kinase [Spirochaetia bacterium]|nr:thymidine kinase [Spirochaetia bacterium]
MAISAQSGEMTSFLKSLGFPEFRIHSAVSHFDFSRGGRRILVIGPMGSGKTEYSSRVWRDSQVALRKSESLGRKMRSGSADRRKVFFVRSSLDSGRFPDYPEDALAYRGGYERCGTAIARIRDSFELEALIAGHPEFGTWILDEVSFYDERIAYVVLRESERNGLVFIFPTLILNFRKDIFNSTARLLLELSTDVFPLTAYCEHPDCMKDSFYTYRYYRIDGLECPALYFDPLIIIGGDREKKDPREPSYCTRCDAHHYLPGKEYTYLILKPLGVDASRGDLKPLLNELALMQSNMDASLLFRHFSGKHIDTGDADEMVNMNALRVPCIAEKAALYLYLEQNLLSLDQLRRVARELRLDEEYIARTLADQGRKVEISAGTTFGP